MNQFELAETQQTHRQQQIYEELLDAMAENPLVAAEYYGLLKGREEYYRRQTLLPPENLAKTIECMEHHILRAFNKPEMLEKLADFKLANTPEMQLVVRCTEKAKSLREVA